MKRKEDSTNDNDCSAKYPKCQGLLKQPDEKKVNSFLSQSKKVSAVEFSSSIKENRIKADEDSTFENIDSS